MKLHQRYPVRQGGKRRRRLELAMFAPLVEPDGDAWVDTLSDDEFGAVLGSSWYEITGRNAGHLIAEHLTSAA